MAVFLVSMLMGWRGAAVAALATAASGNLTLARAKKLLAAGRTSNDFASAYLEEVRRLIAPRNLAGLADPDRNRLYPVDLEALVSQAHLLGLTTEEMRRRLPRLRGY